jgi:two-component system cell cycle sensor histidine kinase/response regulator CckA
MTFNQVSHRRVWQAEERRFLDAVANLVTLALQRIRITEEHRRGQERRHLGERVAAMAQVAGGAGADLERALAAMSEAADRLAASGLAASGPATGAGGAAGEVEPLQAIRRAIASARQTTAQLLALARCRAQRPQPITAAAAIERLRLALAAVPGGHASCQLHDHALATPLRADPLLLDQALGALALSLHRTQPPAAAFAIAAERRALDPAQARHLRLEAGDYLAIAISGPARRPALPAAERAFDGLAAVPLDGDGPDLGAILATAIITCMDGVITASAAAGTGSTLTVYLPVAMVAETGRQATPLRLPALGGRETVLLVEDDPALLGLVGDSLRHLGYQVLLASAGQEALDVAERHAGRIDLLLTDVVLPQLSGHALAAQLVQLRKDLRVVLMSGFPSDAFSAHREFAHAAFLAKPFTIDELVRTVRSALDAGRTAAG